MAVPPEAFHGARKRRMATRTTDIGTIQMDGFSAKGDQRGDAIVVSLRGNADMAVQEKLKTFLDGVASAARSGRIKETIFELNDLYFMNSSCLSLFLRFINGVLELNESQRYKLRFRSNANLKWQQKSLQALHSYAKELVVIE
jgi:anti-anti-sigma factor